MKSIRLRDSHFECVRSGLSTYIQPPRYFVWDRADIDMLPTLTVYTGSHIVKSVHDKCGHPKVAWLLESPGCEGTLYDWVIKNARSFALISTFNRELLERGAPFEFVPAAGCWINPDEQRIHPKSKHVSIIASQKRFLPGHMLRHEIVDRFRHDSKFSVFGRGCGSHTQTPTKDPGYMSLDNKGDGLRDYMFSFAIENVSADYYFTEKLIDCFVTGTVPIFWGCPSIAKFFDVRGMVIIKSVADVDFSKYTKELYEKAMPFIEANFETAKQYIAAEHYMWINTSLSNHVG